MTVLLRYGLGNTGLWKTHRPLWLRKFAAEEQTPEFARDNEGGAQRETLLQTYSRPWTRWTLAVILSTLATTVVGITAALVWQDHHYAQVYTIPVAPSVSLLVPVQLLDIF